MTTLITGVGAVGSHVAARLQQLGDRVVVYDIAPQLDFLRTILDLDAATVVVGDVNDIDLLEATIRGERVERVVHLAGLLTRGLRDRPYAGVKLNILGTASVLEAARRCGLVRVVFASTRGVNQLAHRQDAGGVLDEDFAMRVLSDRPKTMYELTKLTGEHLGLLYHDAYGVDFVALRLGGGFGPTPGIPNSMTCGVLRPLVHAAALGRPVVIDDPSLTYAGRHEFIYFKDDAEAIALACFAEAPKKRVYNIRMDRTYEYAEVVEVVCHVFPNALIELRASAAASLSPGHAPRDDFADTSAAKAELGWTPRFDLESGIRDWGRWIVRNRRLEDH